MTLTGSIMGTAQYLSPEQAQGQPVSAASDLYSVGVILYELLTGDGAVRRRDRRGDRLQAGLRRSRRPPSAVNPAVPAALDAVVLRALAKDPSARFGDAEEFIAALRSARERLPASAATAIFASQPADATPQATGAHGVVPPGMALSTGVPPAALLLAPDGGSLGSHPPDDEGDRAAKRRRGLRWAIAATVVAALVALVLVLALTRPSSSGGGTVAVPSVAGQSEAAASATLRRAGLIPVPALTANASVPSGVVIGETPPAGSLVGRGTRVTIAVSTGPGSSALPNVVGLTAAQATAKLQAGWVQADERNPVEHDRIERAGDLDRSDRRHGAAGRQPGHGDRFRRARPDDGPQRCRRIPGRGRSGAHQRQAGGRHGHAADEQRTAAGHGARTVARRGLLAGGRRQGRT